MKVKHFGINESGRDFVVGDIHGCFGKLKDWMIANNFDVTKDRMFSVGDLVDRGQYSEDCSQWLNKSWFHAVRGNHEQMAIDMFYGNWEADNYILNGGAWFLGLTHEEQRCYVDLFEEMPIAIDVETKDGFIGIVHAECPVDDWSILESKLSGDMSDAFKEACLWDRFRIEHKVDAVVANVKSIFCGHSPVGGVVQLGNHFFIDTGAVFKSGYLTVVQING
jgi:serine/threonine protein phosphatase 1